MRSASFALAALLLSIVVATPRRVDAPEAAVPCPLVVADVPDADPNGELERWLQRRYLHRKAR